MSHLAKKVGNLYEKKYVLDQNLSDVNCKIEKSLEKLGGAITYVAKNVPPDTEVYILDYKSTPWKGYDDKSVHKKVPVYDNVQIPNLEDMKSNKSLTLAHGNIISFSEDDFSKPKRELNTIDDVVLFLSNLDKTTIEMIGDGLDKAIKEYGVVLPKNYQPKKPSTK